MQTYVQVEFVQVYHGIRAVKTSVGQLKCDCQRRTSAKLVHSRTIPHGDASHSLDFINIFLLMNALVVWILSRNGIFLISDHCESICFRTRQAHQWMYLWKRIPHNKRDWPQIVCEFRIWNVIHTRLLRLSLFSRTLTKTEIERWRQQRNYWKHLLRGRTNLWACRRVIGPA